jgi:membrane protein
MAAALAFFGLFAVPPLIVAILLVGGEIFGDEQVRLEFLENLATHFGPGVEEAFAGMLEHLPRLGEGELLTQALSALVLFLAATAGFGHLQGILNVIWQAPRRRKGVALLLQAVKRVFSLVFVLAFSLALLGSATLGLAVHVSPDGLTQMLPSFLEPLTRQVVGSLGFMTLAFLGLTIVFQVLPDTRVPWRSAALGALGSTLLLGVAKQLLALYLSHSWQSEAFGAAGSVVATLTSFYVAALALLVGAVLARVHARGPAGPEGPQSARVAG